MKDKSTYLTGGPPALVLAVLVGCGSCSQQAPEQVTQQVSEAIEVKEYEVENLPALGDFLPVLDDGRLLVAPPVNWFRAGRKNEFLTEFYLDKTRRVILPRIRISAEDARLDNMTDVTEDNLLEFVRQIKKRIENQKGLIEQPRPLMLGEVPCARYVKKASFNVQGERGKRTVVGERQIVATLHAGRLYQIDLQVPADTIRTYRDFAYAVVAGLQFPDQEPGDEEPGIKKPAEELES